MPHLLDLFCGAGGAARGYQLAGFCVTGVDNKPQPRYRGDHFVQADALDYVAAHGQEYDVIHASPPCQHYSVLKYFASKDHRKLIEPVRDLLRASHRPYVIENVVGALLDVTLRLCGSMFSLATPCGAQLHRHRLFESNIVLFPPSDCAHTLQVIGVHGHDFRDEKSRWMQRTTPHAQHAIIRFSIHEARAAMGIDWMSRQELSQAIPPAYTEWIGRQLLRSMAMHHSA